MTTCKSFLPAATQATWAATNRLYIDASIIDVGRELASNDGWTRSTDGSIALIEAGACLQCGAGVACRHLRAVERYVAWMHSVFWLNRPFLRA